MKEEYVYETRVSGVHQVNLKRRPEGLIEVLTPYNSYRHVRDGGPPNNHITHELLTEPIGYLQCNHYGRSNLNRLSHLNWEEDMLTLQMNLSPTDFERLNAHRQKRFDLKLRQRYQPDEPKVAPIVVQAHIVDEDFEADESDRKNLIEDLQKQADMKRSLNMRFRVILSIPQHPGFLHQTESPEISTMSLKWPIATPHHLVKLRVGRALPVFYNPESGVIEWHNIPLKFKWNGGHQLAIFTTDQITLEVSEPIEIFQRSDIQGQVTIELKGLLSGLALEYRDPENKRPDDVLLTQQTLLTNEFTLNLEEALASKRFAPRQHLHFPGVILDEMRVADVMMLLEAKGFETMRLEDPNGMTNEENIYTIKAEKHEGPRKLEIFLLIEGVSTQTNRERQIKGQTKFTTPLPVGATSIYIQGKLEGDSKRIVNIINDIQKQLKEQFRHVGAAE
ncbi:MAG TPA: hypothetical protein PLD25_32040 [Chloroflexota bacterium]|nr:hypothetical protein [Chloroflexota bacterium]HUM69072.1 hypothetical protein [Chloroflexota bacterium]